MRLVLCLLFLSIHLKPFAQQLQFSNMSELPLPSQECYNIMQDSKGYIWFSSEAGLCKYNGSDLEVFDKRNGLPEGSTYAVTEDKSGRLWFATSKNRILTYHNGQLQEFPFSKKYETQLKGSLELSYLFSFEESGKNYINTGARTFLVDAEMKDFTELFKPDTNARFYLLKKRNGLIPVNGTHQMQTVYVSSKKASVGYVKIIIKDGNKEKEIRFPYDKNSYPYWRILTAHTSGADFFSFENAVFRLNSDMTYTVQEYPDRVQQIYVDKDGALWVGVRKNGVYYYPDSSDMKHCVTALQEYSVTGICEDKEKGVWCTTLEKGVFYSRNKNIINYTNIKGLNKKAALLKYEGGMILSAAEDNELFVINGNEVQRKQYNQNAIFTVSDVLKTNTGWLVSSKTNVFRTNNDFEFKDYIYIPRTSFVAGAYAIVSIRNERLFALQFSTVSEIIGNELFQKTPQGISSAGKCLLYAGNNLLFIGCKEMLCGMDVNTYAVKKINGLEGEVTDMIKSKKGEVWISTKDNGLYKMKDGAAVNISDGLKLNNVRLFDIAEDKYSRIWLASNIGLICINEESLPVIYDQLNGLSSNEVNKVVASNDKLFFSTNEGVSYFSLNADPSNTALPAIFLNTISVNDRVISKNESSYTFQPNENSLSMYFDLLTFKGNKTRMMYMLEGEYTTAAFVESNQLVLNNLNSGKYKLSVHAVNNSQFLSNKPVVIQFEILKPFWKTVWFILLCILLSGILVFVFIKIIINRIRNKEEEKTKMNKLIAEYQLSALQAQMNPHFIFNAINSIQGYILKKNEQQAYDYLAKFSKLIRMVLNHSREKALPLKQELEMLTLYVELEQLRFERSFEFDLNIDQGINQFEVQVPGMLIQPYVENAIWHGLMNLDKNIKGVLSIHISLDNGLLKIVVKDNGVGRELSKMFKNETSHQSVGMKLTEQRLTMINTLQDYENAKVEVSDLYDENKKACGTKVEIVIPVNEDGK